MTSSINNEICHFLFDKFIYIDMVKNLKIDPKIIEK